MSDPKDVRQVRCSCCGRSIPEKDSFSTDEGILCRPCFGKLCDFEDDVRDHSDD